jgi:aryl-alcohol dehydrogenase-like predicted oxidoreductase
LAEIPSIVLGRTGLRVSRIGVGSSYGIDAAALRDAFEQGMNLFYFGTARTGAMAEAIRALAPSERERMVVAVQSYTPWGWYLPRSVDQALRALGLDYADLLILGKRDQPVAGTLLDQVVRLKESGKVRSVAVSAHRRAVFAEHLQSKVIDVIMVRYNAAHVGAEQDVFPLLPTPSRPGVMVYTATRWGTLLGDVPGEERATAADCYRFVLHHPSVDVCITGPANAQELTAALTAASMPPMTDEALERMRRIGRVVYKRQHHNWLARKLIFD